MQELTSKEKGLTSREAAKRLLEQGENVLESKASISPVKIFAGQFKDLMVLILLAATAVSAFLGEIHEALTIVVIVLVNALLGFFQEMRTEKTLEALSRLAAPVAKAVRDGQLVQLEASQLVVGDIIRLEAGDRVAADAVVLDSVALSCDEALLTGESNPQEKAGLRADISSDKQARESMVFMGSSVASGRGTAMITATGMRTEMGAIASMLEEIQPEPTPLQKRLDQVGRSIGIGCLLICFVVAGVGILRGEDPLNMLITGISLAVAAVPEGLPAIVTISLALAVRRILSRNALIKKLHAVETLGCATVICSDKTGTLTQNRMEARTLFTLSKELLLTDAQDDFSLEIKQAAGQDNGIARLLEAAAYCNNATVESRKQLFGKSKPVSSTGEPTEQALLLMAYKLGVKLNNFTRMNERPFDSQRKCMSVSGVYADGRKMLFAKGAPEMLLACCTRVLSPTGVQELTPKRKRELLEKSDFMASDALRVLGFAFKELSGDLAEEAGLTFIGLAGLQDPPRPEAARAVASCRTAGIRPVMITGDHAITARAIAAQLDILREGDGVLTGTQLEQMTDQQLLDACTDTAVFARVTPYHKLRIIRAMKACGEIAAMTGDGVNDAPALKEANIGVAMGESGTDVTREAAQVILLDDNFATLVAAIEEGRVIYKNIRRFLRYLLSCNAGEVVTMLFGMLMGMPVILTPIQLLLINLVTDGLPAIALGLEPSDGCVMREPPRKPDESIFSGGLMGTILFRGLLIGLSTLGAFTLMLSTGGDLKSARTGALVTLVFSQLFHVFECRGEPGYRRPSLFSNPFLLLSVLISVVVTLVAVYHPVAATIFATSPLQFPQLLLAMACSGVVPLIASVFTHKKRG